MILSLLQIRKQALEKSSSFPKRGAPCHTWEGLPPNPRTVVQRMSLCVGLSGAKADWLRLIFRDSCGWPPHGLGLDPSGSLSRPFPVPTAPPGSLRFCSILHFRLWAFALPLHPAWMPSPPHPCGWTVMTGVTASSPEPWAAAAAPLLTNQSVWNRTTPFPFWWLSVLEIAYLFAYKYFFLHDFSSLQGGTKSFHIHHCFLST